MYWRRDRSRQRYFDHRKQPSEKSYAKGGQLSLNNRRAKGSENKNDDSFTAHYKDKDVAKKPKDNLGKDINAQANQSI